MGEAKRQARKRREAAQFSRPLKRARFNLFAIGTRLSSVSLIADELSWWSSLDEKLIGVVCRDRIDDDYSWVVLARDRIRRFRAVGVGTSCKSQWHAEGELQTEIMKLVADGDLDQLGGQGDETNMPIDLLRVPTDFDPKAVHPYFALLLETPAREPARAVIREIGPWLSPEDPHLIKEFQTRGFDQRLWEIYLWAAFREFGLDISQHEAPDFLCLGPGVDFTVEATTVAPSTSGALAEHPNPRGIDEMSVFLGNYMAMKFGSALHGKLTKTNAEGKRYWERDTSKDKPFILAVADFHKPATENASGSMTYTQSALWQYLYGRRVSWRFEDDVLVTEFHDVSHHKYSGKEIPSGFFDLPDAVHVSAVVFSNAGTLAKFDRMGVVAGFGSDDTKYIRVGLKQNPDANAVVGLPFTSDVSAGDYEEYWTDELQVFHNPNAKRPLPFEWLPGAIHHHFEDGRLKTFAPNDHVLSSYTMLMTVKTD